MAEIPTIARAQILVASNMTGLTGQEPWPQAAACFCREFIVLASVLHLATSYRHFASVATLGSVRGASRQFQCNSFCHQPADNAPFLIQPSNSFQKFFDERIKPT